MLLFVTPHAYTCLMIKFLNRCHLYALYRVTSLQTKSALWEWNVESSLIQTMGAIPLPLGLHEHDNRMYPMTNHFIFFFHTLDGSLSWSRQSKLLVTWTLSDLMAPVLLFIALAINPNVGTSCTRLHVFPACSLQTFRPLPLLLIDDFYLQNERHRHRRLSLFLFLRRFSLLSLYPLYYHV